MAERIADLDGLWRYIAEQFPLGGESIHGPSHWRRVERNGRELAAATPGADEVVVRLFAVLHDSRRENEWTDHEHGLRGAELAQVLRGQFFELEDRRFALLYYACAWHERGRVSNDPTIGACWDADRLDLPRVGVRPMVELMSTAAGKALVKSHR
jgi:uncharacterized protein